MNPITLLKTTPLILDRYFKYLFWYWYDFGRITCLYHSIYRCEPCIFLAFLWKSMVICNNYETAPIMSARAVVQTHTNMCTWKEYQAMVKNDYEIREICWYIYMYEKIREQVSRILTSPNVHIHAFPPPGHPPLSSFYLGGGGGVGGDAGEGARCVALYCSMWSSNL